MSDRPHHVPSFRTVVCLVCAASWLCGAIGCQPSSTAVKSNATDKQPQADHASAKLEAAPLPADDPAAVKQLEEAGFTLTKNKSGTVIGAAIDRREDASELLPLPIGHDGRIDLVLGTTNGFLKLRFNSAVPATGDFDGDGRRSIADVDLLCQQLQLGLVDNRFDLNADSHVSLDDMDYLLTELLQTVIGDVNLDGNFNSSDLVSLFQIGKYEDHVPRNTFWSEGDFNCDGDFTTADLVLAFQKARYSGI